MRLFSQKNPQQNVLHEAYGVVGPTNYGRPADLLRPMFASNKLQCLPHKSQDRTANLINSSPRYRTSETKRKYTNKSNTLNYIVECSALIYRHDHESVFDHVASAYEPLHYVG